MSGDIEKLAVFDGRIIQSRPKYAVSKGALSLTNAPFNAIAATPSQHTYNIYVPSENVFVDRALEWTSTVSMKFSFTPSVPIAAGEPLVKWGRDVALAPFPLNQLCSTLTATINDTTSVINSQDVLNTILRLTDYEDNRLQRTCPTMLDKYQSYNDAFGASNNPLAGWENTTAEDVVPNGAFSGVFFTLPNGKVLETVDNGFVAPVADGSWTVSNGVPVAQAAGIPAGTVCTIYYKWTSTEKLVLSPFVFSDCHEWDTGLFGINNIQLIMNLQSPARTLRSTGRAGRAVDGASIGYNTNATSVFAQSVVNVMFLTPSLDVPLPPKSVVPYMEFPRYITQYQSGTIAAGDKGQILSQTITLPQIPDLFIIYARPQQYTVGNTPGGAVDPTQCDWYFPLATRNDGVNNPLSINFDNFSGLLSSVTTEQLYAMSVKNGLTQSWNEWTGLAHSQAGGTYTGPVFPNGGSAGQARLPLVGGPLVLKPSQDITLQAGQSPSLVGNFTFQFSLFVKNNTAIAQIPQLFVITANSGFFESIRGSSRIIKGVLSEQDIISAPLAPSAPTRDMLRRMVGGGKGMMGSLDNVMMKAKDVYSKTAPSGSGMSGGMPSAGSRSGGGSSGGRSSGGSKISARLM